MNLSLDDLQIKKQNLYLNYCLDYLSKIKFFLDTDLAKNLKQNLNNLSVSSLGRVYSLLRLLWIKEQTFFMKIESQAGLVEESFRLYLANLENKNLIDSTAKDLKSLVL